MRNFENFNFYAISQDGIVKAATFEESIRLNKKQWDIYWTPNEFPFGKRKISDLIAIRYLYGDFDSTNFETITKRLRYFFDPSFVIKTKNGFHVYWELEPLVVGKDGDIESLSTRFRTVMEQVIIPLGADPNAKDVARLLRPPMFRYWKKGNKEEFWTEMIYESSRRYFFKQFENRVTTCNFENNGGVLKTNFNERYFDNQKRKITPHKCQSSDSFWAEANNFDVMEGLKRLSGTKWVNGEVYTFKRAKDHYRIIVNGKPSNAWIDKNGKIGSICGAGPSIPNWLTYFGHDWSTVAKIIKEVFHELRSK
jgi:hypothetical protein